MLNYDFGDYALSRPSPCPPQRRLANEDSKVAFENRGVKQNLRILPSIWQQTAHGGGDWKRSRDEGTEARRGEGKKAEGRRDQGEKMEGGMVQADGRWLMADR